MMAKVKETTFVCNSCGNEFSKWRGQCSACGEWNSLREVKNLGGGKNKRGGGQKAKSGKNGSEVEVFNLGNKENVVKKNEFIFSSGIAEFDRVLGKGIVQGSVMLFSGEPGVGKSTLLSQVVGKIGGLYVAGEESLEQIRLRVSRLGLDEKNFDILATNTLQDIESVLERTKNVYKIMIVDSIQVLVDEEGTGVPGSVTQLKSCTFKLVEMAKRLGIAIFIVGHVTKEGSIAGPKLLEHMVDVVLYFEGEKNGELRILRAIKNRFGSSDEVGVFRMESVGLVEVRSDEVNLISSEMSGVGKTITVVMEGSRPMMVEIQALVTESFAPMPKRGFVGIDYNRGQMLLAVAQKSLGLPLYKDDVFVSVMGGVKIMDTGADLAIIGAVYSSAKNKMISTKKVLMGEVSLIGEVRKVKFFERRVNEAKGLGRQVVEAKTVKDLVAICNR
jgi:DNA repair protein RadA/Sms